MIGDVVVPTRIVGTKSNEWQTAIFPKSGNPSQSNNEEEKKDELQLTLQHLMQG